MREETEHTCQFCYYEYFDGGAYPCSMCVCGEERTDKFQPKGRQNKRKDEPTISKMEQVEDEPLTKCDLCKREGDDICVDCERKKQSGKE